MFAAASGLTVCCCCIFAKNQMLVALTNVLYNDVISPWYSRRDTLKSVVIEEGVTAIGNYTFYDCGKLESITLPESLGRIGDFAFQSCKSLKNVKLPSNLFEIGLTAFSSCSSLGSIEIPERVGARLGANAFMYCRSLKLAKLPGSTNIPDRVLYGCSSLICLSMSPGYTIGDYAFGGCIALSHVLYSGTKEQWNKTCASDEDLSLAFVHFKANGDEVYIRDYGTLYCTICQEILKPRCNHKNKASWDRIEATCTEDGWTSGEYCTDCGDVLTAREVLPAYGHSFYAYTNNGDGSHTSFCYNCGEGLVEKHTFVETNCICGAAAPVIDESITIGEVLALENDLTMKFRINRICRGCCCQRHLRLQHLFLCIQHSAECCFCGSQAGCSYRNADFLWRLHRSLFRLIYGCSN